MADGRRPLRTVTDERKIKKASKATREAVNTVILDVTVNALKHRKEAISLVPVPGLSLAVSVLVKLLKKVQAAETNNSALKALSDTILVLAETLERLAQKVQGAIDEYSSGPERKQVIEELAGPGALDERLKKLLSELNSICDGADKLRQRSFLGRLMYSGRDAETVTDMKERIAMAHHLFLLEGNVTTEKVVTPTSSDTKQAMMLATQKHSEEEHILNTIQRADDAAYLSAANAPKARLQAGTREPIFARLKEWEDGQFADHCAELPVFVLVGEAGTGKSTIASEFAKRLQGRGRLGASYFFTRGMQDLNSPKKFFSTIAWQLARSQPALRGHVVDAAREHLKTATLQQLDREFADLIGGPLHALHGLSSSHPPIFVVVDALDECTEEGQELVPILLRLLLSAAAQPGSPLRVFLTSRPEPHYIHRVFTTPHLASYISVISIQEFRSSVTDDIERLVSARLAEHETSKRWVKADPSRVASIVEKSEALFIYARTAIDFLLADVDDLLSIEERYEILMRVEGTFGLAPLDTLYCTVLESVFPPEDRRLPRVQDRLKRVLGCLATLLEPEGISPRTLVKLAQIPMMDSVSILNKLRSVVLFERDNVDSPFRIIHATFREFLADRSRSGDAFYIDAEEVHGRLADNCKRTTRAFVTAHWPGYSEAALLLQLLTSPLPKLDGLPHVLYAQTYGDHHTRHRALVPPRHTADCEPAGEDDTPPLSSVVSYVRHQDPGAMWDMIRTVTYQWQGTVVTGSRATDALHAMNELLHATHGSQSVVGPHGVIAQIAAVSIILDIQIVGNFAVSDATPLAGSTIRSAATLDGQHVQNLQHALKRAIEADDLEVALRSAHASFHRAVIAAGLTAGHEHQE